jgi:hypothetical protein
MKKIYKEDLREGYACPDQIALFEHHYPQGISVCRYCAQEAQKKGLQVGWLVRFLPYDDDYKFISSHTKVKRFKKPIRVALGDPYDICSTCWVDEPGLIRLERAFLKMKKFVRPLTRLVCAQGYYYGFDSQALRPYLRQELLKPCTK